MWRGGGEEQRQEEDECHRRKNKQPVQHPHAELNPNSSTNSLSRTTVHSGTMQPFRCKLTSQTALFGADGLSKC